MKTVIAWTLGVHIALAAAAAHSPQALAHGEFAWIQERDRRTGESCCGAHDCFKVDVTYEKGVYRFSVLFAGVLHAYEVPERQAKPSEDGNYWACTPKPGVLRCFFAPPQGS